VNVKILPCVCRDEFQDKRHGRTLRVHNRTKQNKSESERRWRCARCKRESS